MIFKRSAHRGPVSIRTALHRAMLCGLLLVPAMLGRTALADPVEVQVTGTGTTRDEAIAQGLAEAIREVTGVAVSADEMMDSAVASAAITSNGTDTAGVAIAETTQDAIRRTANGVVRSYRVMGTDAGSPGQIMLQLSVSVEKFAPKGGATDRRSVAVATFAAPAGQSGLGILLRDQLTFYLTQTRRFAVLDRANTQVYEREMAMINAEAAVTERAREDQVLAADYVILGTIRTAGVARSNQTIAVTGEQVVSSSADFDVDWQIEEIATREVKWTGTERLDSASGALLSLVGRAAARISDNITQAIYPMRLLDVSDPNAMVINEGGAALHTGQRFRAMLLGKQMTDPYTHESLGQTEHEVAVIEIRRVDDKLSYARLVSGQIPGGDADLVLRPAASFLPQRKATAPAAAPVVKLPGDP